MSPDPFAHPCDYFLYSCTSDKPSTSNVTGARNQDGHGPPRSLRRGDGWPRGSARHEESENGEEGVLDKRAALLLYLRGVLGRALPLQSSLRVRPSAIYCFPSFTPDDFNNRHQSRRTVGAARRCRKPEGSTSPASTPRPSMLLEPSPSSHSFRK